MSYGRATVRFRRIAKSLPIREELLADAPVDGTTVSV